MSMTSLASRRIGINTYKVWYSSSLGDPTFRVYLNGKFFAYTKATSIRIFVNPGDAALVDVYDDDTDPEPTYSRTAILFWYPVSGTDYYKIEEFIDPDWILRAEVKDRGQGAFLWESRFLEDCQVHQFRITPVGTNGNEGTARTWNVLIVGHPDVPDVSITYNQGTNNFTIAEA